MSYRIVDVRNSIYRHPTRKWGKHKKIKRIVVHCTGSDSQSPNRTSRYHATPSPKNHISKKGAPAICYHDYIDKKGLVSHCNDYQDVTWHSSGWNRGGIGVVLAYAPQKGQMPTTEQMDALLQHLTSLCLFFKLNPLKAIKGHREASSIRTVLGNGSVRYKKTCPGMCIDLDALRREITIRLQKRLKQEGLYGGDIDGQFGPVSKRALQSFSVTTRFNTRKRINWWNGA